MEEPGQIHKHTFVSRCPSGQCDCLAQPPNSEWAHPLTIAGEGQRFPEVLADHCDSDVDPQGLMQLLLADGGRPHQASIGRGVAMREGSPQTAGVDGQKGRKTDG